MHKTIWGILYGPYGVCLFRCGSLSSQHNVLLSADSGVSSLCFVDFVSHRSRVGGMIFVLCGICTFEHMAFVLYDLCTLLGFVLCDLCALLGFVLCDLCALLVFVLCGVYFAGACVIFGRVLTVSVPAFRVL